MYIIVGLGNPEPEYSNTRHNMGFDVINKLAKENDIKLNKTKFNAIYGSGIIENEKVILIKPQTFMNNSGSSVEEYINFYKIPLENMIIIYDDMDTPVGQIRIKLKGSSGGQKGMMSIIDMMHTEDIKRIKIGIGRATSPVVDYVLNVPNKEDFEKINIAQDKACLAIEEYLKHDFNYIMSRYNK